MAFDERDPAPLRRLLADAMAVGGVGQHQLAAALGIRAPAVNQWLTLNENRRSRPDPEKFPAIAELLGIDERDLHRAYALEVARRKGILSSLLTDPEPEEPQFEAPEDTEERKLVAAWRREDFASLLRLVSEKMRATGASAAAPEPKVTRKRSSAPAIPLPQPA